MHSPFGNFEKFKSTDGRLVLFPHCRKALAAVYGSVVVGLERNLCLFAAVCAKDEILTAILAFKGLVFEHFATSLNMDK